MARPKSKGLGDTIEKVIKSTGLQIFVDGKDCGCEERKEKLNQLFPYRFKARCLTEQEYNEYKEFKNTITLKLSREQVNYICNLYASIFNRQVWYPCTGCSPKPLITMIDKLDKVFESYEN